MAELANHSICLPNPTYQLFALPFAVFQMGNFWNTRRQKSFLSLYL
jgi:hypothetical protein